MDYEEFEEFEAFQRIEQLREPDLESMVSPQLLTEEHRGKDRSAPFGVGLEVSDPLAVGGGKSEQPQNQRGERRDEQQGFEALGAFGAYVAQCEPESLATTIRSDDSMHVDPLTDCISAFSP